MENTKTIGDRTYSFGVIPPTEAIRVEVAIARVVGEPLLKALLSTQKVEGATPEQLAAQQEQAGVAAIGLMMSKMTPEEVLNVMQSVFTYVGMGGKARIDFNTDFLGRNKEVWQVFIAALRFNFSDFLPAKLSTSLQNVAQRVSG